MKTLLNRYYFAILGVLGAVSLGSSFVLGMEEGRASGSREPVSLNCSDSVLTTLAIPVSELAAGKETPLAGAKTGVFVGSKNGTKYYTPGCSGAKRIKPENYVWFKSADDAKLQGYTPGKC